MALSLLVVCAGLVVNVPVPAPPHQPSAVMRPVLGDFVPRPPSVSSSGLIFPATVDLPSTLMARVSSSGKLDFDIGSMLDDIPSPGSDAADIKAAALRAEIEQAEAVKAARAEKAIARMALEDERKVREMERIAASGVPECESSVWGSGSTGLLSAKACSRVRDGVVEQRAVSGSRTEQRRTLLLCMPCKQLRASRDSISRCAENGRSLDLLSRLWYKQRHQLYFRMHAIERW